jgi:HEAT repeat protein
MKRDNIMPPTGDDEVLIAAHVASHLATLVAITSSARAQDAAEALARLGPRGLQALADALADTRLDIESRQWAALALGDSGDEAAALGPLVAALGYTGARYLPFAAAVALGRLGTVGAAEALTEALADTSGVFGTAHVNALRRIGAPAVPALLQALAAGSATQRRWAVYVVGWARDPQAFAPLLAALSDPEAAVRNEAAGALGWLGDTRATSALLTLLDDPSPSVRVTAASVLGRFGEAEAIPALERLRREDHSEDDGGYTVSETAAWALETIRKKREQPGNP